MPFTRCPLKGSQPNAGVSVARDPAFLLPQVHPWLRFCTMGIVYLQLLLKLLAGYLKRAYGRGVTIISGNAKKSFEIKHMALRPSTAN